MLSNAKARCGRAYYREPVDMPGWLSEWNKNLLDEENVRRAEMRTVLILIVGLLLLAAFAIFSKLFSEPYPAATNWGISAFVLIWLGATGFNMWVGVSRAGYSVAEELPIFLLLFAVPTIVALVVKWKFL